jgi:hypothetical protein
MAGELKRIQQLQGVAAAVGNDPGSRSGVLHGDTGKHFL